jgi:hypothetical protein
MALDRKNTSLKIEVFILGKLVIWRGLLFMVDNFNIGLKYIAQ